MLLIHRLILTNFKSWRGQHTVGPFSSCITCVIGPNGSGKSNLMEAIAFVVGVKTKKLRGDSLRDLVYDADKKAMGTNRAASVEMVFVNQGATSKEEDVEMQENEELVFKRSIRAGETGSTFEINGKKVSFEEYEEKLSSMGVVAAARNFLVFQGDVEATAQMTPTQLRELFELLSGSGELAEEYENLQMEKDKLETIALEAIARKKEVAADRKEAKEQKEETDRYRELATHRDELRVRKALLSVLQETRRAASARVEVQEAHSYFKECERVEEAMGEELKTAKAEAAAKVREVSKSETGLGKVTKQQSQASTSHAKKTEALARARVKRREAEANLRAAREQLEKQGQEVEDINNALGRLREREAEMISEQQQEQDQQEKVEQGESLSPGDRARLDELRERADAETAELQAQHQRLEREGESVRERLALHKRGDSQLEQRLEELSQERASLQKRKQKTESSVALLQARVADGERLVQEEKARMDAVQDQLVVKREQLGEAKALLSGAKARTQESKRAKRLGECIASLSRHFTGVRGRLCDLVRPTQRKYALALDTAFGRHMDSIVVDRETTAFECVKYLREQRLGVCTFIPLDAVRLKPVSEERRAMCANSNGVFRLCVDVVDFDDPAVARAVQFAVGDAVVCDTLADARRLRFQNRVRVKAVTLDGHVISPRGEMTGGTTSFGEGGGRVDRFAESALQSARDARDRLETEITELEQSIANRSSQVDLDVASANAANRLKFALADVETTQRKIDDVDARTRDVEKALRESRPKREELETRLKSLGDEIEEIANRIEQVEDRVFAEFGGRTSKHARELERREAEARTKRQNDLVEIRDQLRKLESQLRYVESRDRNQLVAEGEESEAEAVRSVNELEDDVAKSKRVLEESEAAVRQSETQHKLLSTELEAAQVKVKSAQSRLAESAKEKGVAAKRATAAEAHLQRVRALRAEIIHRAALDGVDLPKKKVTTSMRGGEGLNESFDFGSLTSIEKMKTSSKKKKNKTPTSGKRRTSAAAAFADFDSSSDSEQDEAKDEEKEKEDDNDDYDDNENEDEKKKSEIESWTESDFTSKIEACDAEIRTTSEQIEALAPNTRADARLNDATTRLKDSDASLAEAREAARVASEAFQEIRTRRKELFMGIFNHVADRIDGVYKELTRRENAPLGGSAFLALEDSEDPYLGGIKFDCMPPNKRFRVMESLSGGEKTVAALALLFSIHSFRPSPFFVMDEVDAALDNENVVRIAEYLRSRSTSSSSAIPLSSTLPLMTTTTNVTMEEEKKLNPFQCIVISLKDVFYERSNSLVGVFRDQAMDASSCVTLDLSLYEE